MLADAFLAIIICFAIATAPYLYFLISLPLLQWLRRTCRLEVQTTATLVTVVAYRFIRHRRFGEKWPGERQTSCKQRALAQSIF